MLIGGAVAETKRFSAEARQERGVSMATQLIRGWFNRVADRSVTPVTRS